MKPILFILPAIDYDPSEMAISAAKIRNAGYKIMFATPNGAPSIPDEIMLMGRGLDIWGNIPVLKNFVLFGKFLMANKDAIKAHNEISQTYEFLHPIKYENIENYEFSGIIIPGGHKARGMRPFLENEVLQNLIVQFFKQNLVIGSICHGTLLIARSIDKTTNKSIIASRKCTALTWELESKANKIGNILRYFDKNYYRTYVENKKQPIGFMGVEAEIKRLIGFEYFQNVPRNSKNYFKKTSGIFRDTESDKTPSFIVKDGNFISARWPGDVHAFADGFLDLLRSFYK